VFLDEVERRDMLDGRFQVRNAPSGALAQPAIWQ
jgi:hypothetical protein